MVHMESYTTLYGKKEQYDTILNVLVPCVSCLVPYAKWTCFPEMRHLIENAYGKVCFDLTRYSFSEFFSPLRGRSPQNLS